MPQPGEDNARASFRRGLRLGVPFAVVGFFLSVSFGVLARQAGFSVAQASVTAVIVFAGSAQFAALSVVTVGGGIPAALTAGTLMNARFLAMGIALAPSLPGGPVKRAAQGVTVVDSSWALANQGDGTFDRWLLFGTTVPQYLTWTLGSVVGAVSGDALGDVDRGRLVQADVRQRWVAEQVGARGVGQPHADDDHRGDHGDQAGTAGVAPAGRRARGGPGTRHDVGGHCSSGAPAESLIHRVSAGICRDRWW